MGARGARGRLRAALPRHCTRLTHVQCNSNAPRGRPPLQAPTPAACHRGSFQRGLCQTTHPTPPPGGGETEGGGGGVATFPWTQASARKARRAGPQVLYCQANPTVFGNPRKNVRGVERRRPPPRPARPPAPTLTLSMELPAGVVARLSCRYPLAFSQMARLAGPDSAFLRPRTARAALKECRAALGRGLLLGPGQRTDGQTGPRPSLSSPLPWLWLHGEEKAVTPTARNKGWGEQHCAGAGGREIPAGTHSDSCRARGRCSTSGYSRSAASSSRRSQWVTTAVSEAHHLATGSVPVGSRGVGGEAPCNSATLYLKLSWESQGRGLGAHRWRWPCWS